MKLSTHKKIAIAILAVTAITGIFVIAAALIFPATDQGGLGLTRRLAVVRVEGVITDAGWHTGILREHLNNRNIAGVLLRIDSPGGAVAPSQEIYNEIAAYKASGKPLIVSMGNTAASGGYYIAAPAERIFASPGTLTGSIGVIFSLPMYQELAKKVGIDFRVLKAGEMKDVGSAFRPMTDSEKAALQTLLDDVHEQFINDVAAGRQVDTSEVRSIANGMIFTGKQAFEIGLVDTLGGYADALRYLGEICGVPESVKPVEKKPYVGWREWFMESAQRRVPGLETVARPAGLYYLFVP
ncbi:MAG: signal peptide peptidase SppA [Chitinispirillia bacterium]|nr:signal peptide peptidase SppA [Chitinispirillia bacterium]MCL2267654.1 signal peptide peptidase SppA [Chitinispirillia bacterium]